MLPPPQDPQLPGKCAGCRLPPSDCICAQLRAVASELHVLIVRHRSEIPLASNTGRLAHRSLPNSTMVDYGLRDQPLDLSQTLGPDTWVLAPGPPTQGQPKVRTLVVLDGAWSHVGSMRRRIPPLSTLPVLSLPPPLHAPLRMRRGETPDQMATIEAIAHALRFLGEPIAAATLAHNFDTMARTMRQLRGLDPRPPRPQH